MPNEWNASTVLHTTIVTVLLPAPVGFKLPVDVFCSRLSTASANTDSFLFKSIYWCCYVIDIIIWIYHIWFSPMPDINTVAVENKQTNLQLYSTLGSLRVVGWFINILSDTHFALFLKRCVSMIKMLPLPFISSRIMQWWPSCVGSYLCSQCKDTLTVFDRWGDASYHGVLYFHQD